MWKNYFKIAWRNLSRNKGFSAINIFGLAIGIATCLVIMLFVVDELSYDRFHEKSDRIVRVLFRGSVQGEKMNEASVMPPVAHTLLAEYPEVEEATRMKDYGKPKITYGEKVFRDNSFAFADSNFFQVFTLPLIKGDPATALTQPNMVVISQTTAQKLFGKKDPIGQVLHFKDFNASLQVSGVMADIPENSHFHFDLLASMASFPDANINSWMVSDFHTYLVLPKGYDYKKLETKLPQVVQKYMGPQLQQAMGISLAQFREAGNDLGLYLQPLSEIHLHSEARNDLEPGGDVRYVYLFGAIALFMLLVACINFMNLSTAGASKRTKEVGVRKVLGSGKTHLVRQFLTESFLLSLLAMALALVLVIVALPFFNQLAGKQLVFNFLSQPLLLPGMLLLTLIVGVVAGSYPAFFLSSFNPVSVLKGIKGIGTSGDKNLSLRSGLVVFQFMISIGLIIGTLVVYQQLQYIQNKEVGYEKEQVLILPEVSLLGNNLEAFRQQLLQDPRVLRVSTSGYLPAGASYNNNFFVNPADEVTQGVKTLRYDVDEQYISTLGMKILEGRNFSIQYGADSASAILNETAAKALGWRKDAIGKVITHYNNEGEKTSYRIVGIVEDFHFRSLHEPISPLVMVLGRQEGSVIVKAKTTDMGGLVANIQEEWTKFNAEEPFTYSFLDERFNQTYKAERKMGLILGIFAGLTIFVACLGLFGLALFTAERRTKEIGIRKVLGASVQNVVVLLSKDFIKLVLVALLLASPVAWYFMQHWLQSFAYRIHISWWLFIVAGMGAILIALFTVSFHAIKAAIKNPVKNLRTE